MLTHVDACVYNATLYTHPPHPGNPNLYVCNNDCTVKVFELQPQQLRQAFLLRCSVAINYVSTSTTDPANLLAVGDSKDVYLYRMVRLRLTTHRHFETRVDEPALHVQHGLC